MAADDIASFGGVRVCHDQKDIAEFNCAPDTVDSDWGEALSAAKKVAGMVFDIESRTWVAQLSR